MATSAGPVQYQAKSWRVRTWIRALALLQSFGWISLAWATGFRGDGMDLLGTIAFALFVVLPPCFALIPVIKLRADGRLLLRGWTTRRLANAAEINRLAMNKYGLKFKFNDGTTYTSVIFQATRSFGRPRVLEFVDALRGKPGSSPSFNPMDLYLQPEIEIFRSEDLGAQ